MKTPIWAVVTAILMILFGMFSMLSALQGIKKTNPVEPMGQMLDTLKNQPSAFPDSVVYHINDSTFTINYDSIFNEAGGMMGMMDKFLSMSEETISKLKRSYKWSLAFSIVLVVAGILLFWRKQFVPIVAVVATAIFILAQFNILVIIFKSKSGLFASMPVMLQALFYTIIGITCFCLIIFSNHKNYKGV